MVDAMRTDLAAIGIPFFGTKNHLIREVPKEPNIGEPATIASLGSDAKNAKITRAELLSLQKRMLQFLEDMFKE